MLASSVWRALRDGHHVVDRQGEDWLGERAGHHDQLVVDAIPRHARLDGDLCRRGRVDELERVKWGSDDAVVTQPKDCVVPTTPPRLLLDHEPVAALVVSVLRVVTHEVVGAALQADLRAISRVRGHVDGECRVVREGVTAQVWPEGSDHVIGEKVVIAAAIFGLRPRVHVRHLASLNREEQVNGRRAEHVQQVGHLRPKLHPAKLACHTHGKPEGLGRVVRRFICPRGVGACQRVIANRLVEGQRVFSVGVVDCHLARAVVRASGRDV
eukprot:scaffold66629_cov70-Phaeocystis_antarctica.AAC.7